MNNELDELIYCNENNINNNTYNNTDSNNHNTLNECILLIQIVRICFIVCLHNLDKQIYSR